MLQRFAVPVTDMWLRESVRSVGLESVVVASSGTADPGRCSGRWDARSDHGQQSAVV